MYMCFLHDFLDKVLLQHLDASFLLLVNFNTKEIGESAFYGDLEVSFFDVCYGIIAVFLGPGGKDRVVGVKKVYHLSAKKNTRINIGLLESYSLETLGKVSVPNLASYCFCPYMFLFNLRTRSLVFPLAISNPFGILMYS